MKNVKVLLQMKKIVKNRKSKKIFTKDNKISYSIYNIQTDFDMLLYSNKSLSMPIINRIKTFVIL